MKRMYIEFILINPLIFVFVAKSQDWWDAHLESGGYGFWLSYVPKVLLAVVIALMDEAYFKVAVWLNDLGMYANIIIDSLHFNTYLSLSL